MPPKSSNLTEWITTRPKNTVEADRLAAMQALASEDGAAALFESYRRQVYRITRAVTGDHELARDAVQEAFLRVFRSLSQWRGDSSLRTWVARIAVRAAVDLRRQSVRHNSATVPAYEPSHDPRASIEDTLALRNVQELTERLEGQQGLVLRLRLLGGLGNREIAQVLGISEPNVRMQLTKAIRRLREML